MEQNDKISFRQIMTGVFLGLLSPAVRVLPATSVSIAGKAAWLAPVLAALPSVLYIWLLTSFVKSRKDGEGLGHMFMRSIGRVPGKIVMVVYIVWLLFYSSFVLRTAAERLVSSVYESGSITIFLVMTVGASAIAASGKVKSLFRTAEVFMPIILISVAVVLVLALSDVKIDNLLPVTYLETKEILLSTLPVLNVVCVVEYFMFLTVSVPKEPEETKTGIKYVMLGLPLIFFEGLVTIGSLSAELTAKIKTPFFIMIRNVKVLGIAERIESVVIGLWVVTDFIFLAVLIMIIGRLSCDLLNTDLHKGFVWFSAIIIFAVSYFIAPDAFVLQKLSKIIVPVINMSLGYVFVPLIFLIGKIRKRI